MNSVQHWSHFRFFSFASETAPGRNATYYWDFVSELNERAAPSRAKSLFFRMLPRSRMGRECCGSRPSIIIPRPFQRH